MVMRGMTVSDRDRTVIGRLSGSGRNVHVPYLGDGRRRIRDLRVHSSFRCPASDPDYG